VGELMCVSALFIDQLFTLSIFWISDRLVTVFCMDLV
jgi:hypothetical protein